MLKYKIPQIVTLTRFYVDPFISDVAGDNINKKPLLLQWFFRVGMRRLERPTPTSRT